MWFVFLDSISSVCIQWFFFGFLNILYPEACMNDKIFLLGKYILFFRKSETIITYTWELIVKLEFLHVTSRFLKSQSKRIKCTLQNSRELLIHWDKKIPTIWKEYISSFKLFQMTSAVQARIWSPRWFESFKWFCK